MNGLDDEGLKGSGKDESGSGAPLSRLRLRHSSSTNDGPTKRAIILVACLLLALVFAFLFEQAVVGGTPAPTSLTLATASVDTFPIVANASGTVVPSAAIGVNFVTPGDLIEIDVTVGQAVTKGQVLAKIDSTMAQAEVAAAKGELSAATNSGSFAQAQGALAKANADLAETTLTAPVNGSIQAINGQVGELVSANATTEASLPGTGAPIPEATDSGTITSNGPLPLFELATSTGLVVGAAFSPSDGPLLTAGQKGTLTSSAIVGLSIPCHVMARSTTATMVSNVPTYYASIALDASDGRLLSGMPVSVSITVGQVNHALAVPSQAVYVLGGRPNVDVWFKGRAVPTAITVGMVGDQLTEVKSGLTTGQQVVLSTPDGLPPGASTASS